MPPQGDCPFCQLISNPDQLITVGETDNFYAWLEVNPRARGHTMIVPKEHKENVLEFNEGEWTEAFNLAREVVQKAKDGLGADGASITVNIEEAGGQMLPHAYIQVFPRFAGEETAGTPTGAIFPQQEELQQELDSIQDEMNSVSFTFGGGETHEPHPESQKFKSESKIDSILDGAGSSEKKFKDSEDEETESEDESEAESSKPESKEVEIKQMSDFDVLQMLIDRHGSAENLFESKDFQRLLKENEKRLVETRYRDRKSSFDWQ